MNNGFIIIDKPKDLTSHDIVNIARKKFNTKKIGHAGTLDPFATGVLVLAVNKATKFLQFLFTDSKKYYVKAKLGIKTDTYDITGKITQEMQVNDLNEEQIKSAINTFLGEYYQMPPIYCAKKIAGKRAYELAREGKEVKLEKILVQIKSIENIKVDVESKEFEFEVEVSSGTYIRSLINDIGEKTGFLATTTQLRRLNSGLFDIKDSCTIDTMDEKHLLKLDDYVNLPKVIINNPERAKNGVHIYLDDIKEYEKFNKDDYIKMYDEENTFIGIGIADRNSTFIKTLKNMEKSERIVKIYKILR